jgi:hypothetical protein
MDVVTASFLVLAALGACAALLHMVGWVPPRYKRVLSDLQTAFAQHIGVEVENALERVYVRQQAKLEAAGAAVAAEAAGQLRSAEMSMVRSVGVDKQMRAQVDAALAEAILGPAMPILRQFAPGLAETLEENPQMVEVIINHPLFKKYVEPRIAQFLGSQKGPETGGSNPFEVGP